MRKLISSPLALSIWTSLRKPLQQAIGAALVTAMLSLRIPNSYRAEARILPTESKGVGGMGGLAAAAAAFGVGVPGTQSGDTAYLDILNSRWLGESLLKETYIFKEKSWQFGNEQQYKMSLHEYLSGKPSDSSRLINMDRAFKGLGGVFSCARDLKSGLLTLSAETQSPELSQQVVRKATKLLEEFVISRARTRGRNKVAFAQARLKEAEIEQANTEAELRTFLYANRNYQQSSDPSVRLTGDRLSSELILRRQVLSTIVLSREQALMEEKDDTPILNILDSGNLPLEKSKPARSMYVVLAFLLVGVGSWTWCNWAWINTYLLNFSDDNPHERDATT